MTSPLARRVAVGKKKATGRFYRTDVPPWVAAFVLLGYRVTQ